MILALALSLSLGATDGALSLPPWPLSPDGDRVAVPGGAELSAEGGSVEREGAGVWRVHPDPGSEKVLLRAGSAVAEASVGPPTGRILISADPRLPIKGRDRQVRFRFDVVGAGDEPLAVVAPPVVTVSAGTLGTLEPGDAPGRFVATWEPSDAPQPEVLGLVAIAPRCPLCATPLAAGVARVPVGAAIDLPGKSEPGVETRVEIAGRAWGPVRADLDGRFSVPVIVPPGSRWAYATSLSATGNERRSKLDLRLPESPGFHCAVWPRRVVADGRTEAGLHCVAWTAAGDPLDPAPLNAKAARGRVRAERTRAGAWSARYVPPAGGAGTDSIGVAWGPLPSLKKVLEVGLAAGAPATIGWEVEGEPAIPGGRLRASARALDLRGDPVGDAASVDGAFAGGVLQARSDLGDGVQRLRLRYDHAPGGPAASLSVHRAGGEWIAVARDVEARPVPGVQVRFGSGAGGATDGRGEVRCTARGAAETAIGPEGLRGIGWEEAPLPVPPLEVEREVTLALRPAGRVDVVAELQGRWVYWRVLSPDGEPLGGRVVSVAGGSVDLGPVEPLDRRWRCAVRGGTGTVAITDVESGTTALVEVR